MAEKLIPLDHPGVMLLEDYLEPLGITQYQLAKAISVQQTRISEIVRGRRRITPETGIRIARALGHADDFWVQLQADYDMRMARREMGDLKIQRVVTA